MAVEAARWRQIGTNVDVVVSGAPLAAARTAVETTVGAADAALSRFRSDSELSLLNLSGARRTVVSRLLALAIDTALRAAHQTDGLVDPTVGRAVRLAGYDRDFGLLRGTDDPRPLVFEAVAGWRAVEWNAARRMVRLPRGVELDLDSTGKALVVDLAMEAAATALPQGAGVLVSIGGDLAGTGTPPQPAAGGCFCRRTAARRRTPTDRSSQFAPGRLRHRAPPSAAGGGTARCCII